MKFSFTKRIFYKDPNLTNKILAGGRGGGGGVARVSDFFVSKESKSEKKFFLRG